MHNIDSSRVSALKSQLWAGGAGSPLCLHLLSRGLPKKWEHRKAGFVNGKIPFEKAVSFFPYCCVYTGSRRWDCVGLDFTTQLVDKANVFPCSCEIHSDKWFWAPVAVYST